MKNLIIHPNDPSNSYLFQLYAPLSNKTVIAGGITQTELRELIKTHDRVLMFGRGNECGLQPMGQFPDDEYYVINASFLNELWHKTNSIFIWCNSDFFLVNNVLNGLCCGMFILQIDEAHRCGFNNIDFSLITDSNEVFVSIMARHINEPNDELFRNLIKEYGVLAKRNPIAKYNLKELSLFQNSEEDRVRLMIQRFNKPVKRSSPCRNTSIIMKMDAGR